MNTDFGSLLYSFFEDYLKCRKGLRPSSLKSYRDSAKLFLLFLAEKTGHKVSRLTLADLTCAQVLAFLQSLETDRENQVRTRNHAISAWQPSAAFLIIWPGGFPRCSRKPNMLPPSLRNEPRQRRPSSWSRTRCSPSSLHSRPMAQPHCEIAFCCCFFTTLVREFKKSPISATRTWNWKVNLGYISTEKATNGVFAPCGRRPLPCSNSSWLSTAPMIPSGQCLSRSRVWH